MRKSYFLLIGVIGTVLGATVLVAGLFAASYGELVTIGYARWIGYPYALYAPTLVISGTVLLIIGLFMLRASEEATPTQTEISQTAI
jgi:hypothetical protein